MKTILVDINKYKPIYLYAICLALNQSLLSRVRIINQRVSGNTLPSRNPPPYLCVKLIVNQLILLTRCYHNAGLVYTTLEMKVIDASSSVSVKFLIDC